MTVKEFFDYLDLSNISKFYVGFREDSFYIEVPSFRKLIYLYGDDELYKFSVDYESLYINVL